MKDITGPKAINIIRPYKHLTTTEEKPPVVGFTISHSSNKKRITTQQPTHDNRKLQQRSSRTFSLYDPKKKDVNNHNNKPSMEIYVSKKKRAMIEEGSNHNNKLHLLLDQHNNMYAGSHIASETTFSEDIYSDENIVSTGEEDAALTSPGSFEEEDYLSEARISRKIADLKISNKSLLLINNMLESTVRSQAKQLASFKRQMSNEQQEKKYQEVTMAASHSEEESEEKDERFDRILQMTELLVQEAQKALIYQAQETGGKVISGYYHEWHKQE